MRRTNKRGSLKRSHSKLSNFKLSFLCLLCSVSVTGAAASAVTCGTGFLPEETVITAAAISAAAALFSLVLIALFKR